MRGEVIAGGPNLCCSLGVGSVDIVGGWVCVCRSMVVFGVGRYMCVGGGRLCVAGRVYVKVN